MTDMTKVPRVPLEWVVPEGVPSFLATNLSIVQTEHETALTFFEVALPPYQLLESTTSLRARAVARVVIASSRLREFADVFARVAAAQGQASDGVDPSNPEAL